MCVSVGCVGELNLGWQETADGWSSQLDGDQRGFQVLACENVGLLQM